MKSIIASSDLIKLIHFGRLDEVKLIHFGPLYSALLWQKFSLASLFVHVL